MREGDEAKEEEGSKEAVGAGRQGVVEAIVETEGGNNGASSVAPPLSVEFRTVCEDANAFPFPSSVWGECSSGVAAASSRAARVWLWSAGSIAVEASTPLTWEVVS